MQSMLDFVSEKLMAVMKIFRDQIEGHGGAAEGCGNKYKKNRENLYSVNSTLHTVTEVQE